MEILDLLGGFSRFRNDQNLNLHAIIHGHRRSLGAIESDVGILKNSYNKLKIIERIDNPPHRKGVGTTKRC